MPVVELFGGGIRADLPDGFDDISKVRDVPDHQEVYVGSGRGAEGDVSVIVELLDREDQDDVSAAAYHFDELSKGNSASRSSVVKMEPLGHRDVPRMRGDIPKMLITGVQGVRKFGQEDAPEDNVHVALAVIRPLEPSADILVCVNYPGQEECSEAAEALLRSVLGSFEVVDWELFV
mmetsp:Transcript_32743/g.73353  ORF Transcript_32743/g.73353 Transcript_32743/m.73353 type:complete len:177 (+) Transcript_32743:484-1014(+)